MYMFSDDGNDALNNTGRSTYSRSSTKKPKLAFKQGSKKNVLKGLGASGKFYNQVSLDKHYGINTDLKKSVKTTDYDIFIMQRRKFMR